MESFILRVGVTLFDPRQIQSKTFNKTRCWTCASPPSTCTLESSNFYPFKISHNLGRILQGDSPEERKKKLLFNYTDPFNSRRGSHIKTIQSPAILQQHIPESMFHAGCNIFCCSATPPGQISSIYVCVVGGGRRKGKQSCTNKTIISSLWIREPHLQPIHGQVGFVKRVQCRVCSSNAL